LYPIELVGERIRLRELTVDDAPLVLRYASQPEPVFFPPGTASDLASAESWLAKSEAAAHSDVRTRHQLGVVLRETDELIGSARVDVEAVYDLQGSLGYGLWHEHWGRGYATEAAALMLGFGFDSLGLHRIEATVEPSNARSVRVIEKLGLRLEGTLKERFRTPDGWKDSLLYGILEDEWHARRG
jgi:RimJ/RimL family protein N-acetyltransferase